MTVRSFPLPADAAQADLTHRLLADGDVRRIFLRGLSLDMRIGVYAHEMGATQRVSIDVDVYLAPPTKPVQDDIRNVLDYDFIRDEVQAFIADRHINLQETLAEAVAEICLARPEVLAVRVATSKPEAYENCDFVGYEVFRVKRTVA